MAEGVCCRIVCFESGTYVQQPVRTILFRLARRQKFERLYTPVGCMLKQLRGKVNNAGGHVLSARLGVINQPQGGVNIDALQHGFDNTAQVSLGKANTNISSLFSGAKIPT